MSLPSVKKLRGLDPKILYIGMHRGIMQSILDFDYLAGHASPSIQAIITTGRRSERFFFGNKEVLIPCFSKIELIPEGKRTSINLLFNNSSGRRVLVSTLDAYSNLPSLLGGVIFAEGVPERHALQLADETASHGLWLLGGASVGLVVPGSFKLGPIGGIQMNQLEQSKLFTGGSVAVISSSGGMVNELIRSVALSGHAISFALALGGELYPMLTPKDAFLTAEADTETKSIVYFGELGGTDEYILVDLLKSGKVTKPVLTYIAGTVAELFDTPPQFGHAKAMAKNEDESARAKAAALNAAGATACATFGEFAKRIAALPGKIESPVSNASTGLASRKRALMASTVSGDRGDEVYVLGTELLDLAEHNSFATIVISMFLGQRTHSKDLEEFVDFVLRLLVDHGPYVSGAINTMVAARAGKDLVSSLTSGLLTIGPRFGGAINQAASTWLEGVERGIAPSTLVEEMAREKRYISGIGHRKYRVDMPDPRVERLLQFTSSLSKKTFTKFAKGVEAETVRKKGNLILNVDGTIAAVLLDMLSEKEGYSSEQLRLLVDTEFFNALFVLSRSVGFMAHYFDQVRLDEGLFRLSPKDVADVGGYES